MKFLLLCVVCCVALAAANNEQPSEEDFQRVLDVFVQKNGVNCENFEDKCIEVVDTSLPDKKREALNKASKEFCLILMKQYLCEEKKGGNQFIEMYQQYIKTTDELSNLERQ